METTTPPSVERMNEQLYEIFMIFIHSFFGMVFFCKINDKKREEDYCEKIY